jgi:hypothetical protein
MKPWLETKSSLQKFLGARVNGQPEASVLLTRPLPKGSKDTGDSLQIGHALVEALQRQTHQMTMLVGYFGDSGIARGSDNLISLIRSEGAEELCAGIPGESAPSSFRLLFGQLAKNANDTALAFQLYWLVCNWSVKQPGAAAAWRNAVIGAWNSDRSRRLRQESMADAFQDLADICVGIGGLSSGDTDRYADDTKLHWLSDRAAAIKAVGVAPPKEVLEAAKVWGTVMPETSAKLLHWRQASTLFLFLVLRLAEIKVQRIGMQVDGAKGLFHGKLYVVERGREEDADHDTVVLMGSPNWSESALFGGPDRGNTEIAALYRLPGWVAPDALAPELGSKLVQTAHALFEDSDALLVAKWGSKELPTESRLADFLSKGGIEAPPIDPPIRRKRVHPISPEALPLAQTLVYLIDQVLEFTTGADASDSARGLLESHLERSKPEASDTSPAEDAATVLPKFAGKTVPAPQSDGAVRLLALLHPTGSSSNYEGRGVFLADEAGLGKSLIAQMTAFAVILEKVLDAKRPEGDWPLVTILAPRQLVVGDTGTGQAGGQWNRHRIEIIDELRDALSAIAGSGQPTAERAGAALDWLKAESRAYHSERAIRVLSHSDLQRAYHSSDARNDWAHLAGSEVVVIDEAHNFRNGQAARTRLLRFLLTLPVPGEAWPILLEPQQDQTDRQLRTINGGLERSEHDCFARKVICLSATPFNNRFADLVTQLGHFACAQVWPGLDQVTRVRTGRRSDGQYLALPGFEPELYSHLKRWSERPTRNASDAAAFNALLTHISATLDEEAAALEPGEPEDTASFLKSSRELDPLKRESRPPGKDGRLPRDGGPYFDWPNQRYQTLALSIPAVAERLQAIEKAKNDGGGAEAAADGERELELRTEEQARLDEMLSRLFVQRSRTRVIQQTPIEQARTQFRAPDVRRAPLPLNPDGGEVSRADSDLVTNLFKDIYRSDGESRLSMEAYRISTIRNDKSGSTDDATVRNLLGFQRMQLIKRLQSSRYAFLQTVVRGPLKTSLREAALIEWIGKLPKQSLPSWVSQQALKEAAESAKETREEMLALRSESPMQRVLLDAGLSGRLHSESSSFVSLAAWLGAGSTHTDDRERLRQVFGNRMWRRVQNTLAKDCPGERRAWLNKLIEDFAAGPKSKIRRDIDEICRWLFDNSRFESDSPSLIEILPQLDSALADKLFLQTEQERSRALVRDVGLRGVLGALRGYFAVQPINFARSSEVKEIWYKWVAKQLNADHRIRGLFGLALVQANARQRGLSLCSGNKALVFTEYADTTDYIVTVLQIAARLAEAPEDRKPLPNWAKYLAQAARSAITKLNTLWAAETERIQTTESLALHPFRVGGNATDDQQNDGLEHLRALLYEASDEDILKLIASLGADAAAVTGQSSGRLMNEQEAAGDDSVVDEDGEDDFGIASDNETLEEPASSDPDDESPDESAFSAPEEGSTGRHFDGVVDAFAPWYRIEPPAPKEIGGELRGLSEGAARKTVERLDKARQKPVHLLISTEVLSEGVNLQECGLVVHYDLPWNPTRLIQRNGRVDRRINARFETNEGRADIWRALSNLVGKEMDPKASYPTFAAPERVFHITAVPPEPNMSDPSAAAAVTRVREALFLKLSSIQLLFGLSSWPIILNREEAQKVLSGELEVETPGFRRRENLFSERSSIVQRDGFSPGLPRGVGSVLVTLSVEARERLARSISGLRPGEPSVPNAWREVETAGVCTWTPASPNAGRPVRSAPDWEKQQDTPAIVGWFAIGHGESVQLSRWYSQERAGQSRNKTRSHLDLMSIGLAKPNAPESQVLQGRHLDLALGATTTGTVLRDRTRLPKSPAELAEEILLCVTAEFRLNSNLTGQPDSGAGAPDLPQTPTGGSLLLTIWSEQGFIDGFQSEKFGPFAGKDHVRPNPSQPPGINLRVKFPS